MSLFEFHDFINVLLHFLGLSLLAIGGLITTLPEMHRYLVDERHYLSDQSMATSVILAQITPGPNVLFVLMIGWNIGQQVSVQRGWGTILSSIMSFSLGLSALLAAIVPSTLLTLTLARWLSAHQDIKLVRAFRSALAPIVIALIFSTSLLLFRQNTSSWFEWKYLLYFVICVTVLYKTNTHILWLILLGGILGWFGLI